MTAQCGIRIHETSFKGLRRRVNRRKSIFDVFVFNLTR